MGLELETIRVESRAAVVLVSIGTHLVLLERPQAQALHHRLGQALAELSIVAVCPLTNDTPDSEPDPDIYAREVEPHGTE
jgi:hypothetical protein